MSTGLTFHPEPYHLCDSPRQEYDNGSMPALLQGMALPCDTKKNIRHESDKIICNVPNMNCPEDNIILVRTKAATFYT